MSEFKVGDKVVRVKSFDTKSILNIVDISGGVIECNDGLFYSTSPEWTRHATPQEIEVGHRL